MSTAVKGLTVTDLTLAYATGSDVVNDISTTIPAGKITSIIGGNGCGKSTLLRALSALLKPKHGNIIFGENQLDSYSRKQLARELGILPQTPIAPPGIIVTDLVGRGRQPHQGFFGTWTQNDYEVVERALEKTRLTELAHRSVDELSGGQRQRVWIAMALAQDTGCLLLDEPTTYLDIANQLEILDLMIELNQTKDTTIVMVLHDMNLAARYSDHIIAMKNGRIAAVGSPSEVITEENMYEVFGIRCKVVQDCGDPVVLPYGRHHG